MVAWRGGGEFEVGRETAESPRCSCGVADSSMQWYRVFDDGRPPLRFVAGMSASGCRAGRGSSESTTCGRPVGGTLSYGVVEAHYSPSSN